MEKIKAILIVKDQEPKVVEIENSLKSFMKVIDESLSEEERNLSNCNGLDFFRSNISNVGGMVEEYSACHPYDRNRDWHGPALFTEQDMNGETVSMSEENIKAMMEEYSLEKSNIKSPSDFLSRMLGKYGDSIVFNYSQGEHMAVLNTYDAKDALLRSKDEKTIALFERIFICMELEYKDDEKKKNEEITNILKDVCIQMFKQQIEQYKALGF